MRPIEFYVDFFMFYTSLGNSFCISIWFHISVVCDDSAMAFLNFHGICHFLEVHMEVLRVILGLASRSHGKN